MEVISYQEFRKNLAKNLNKVSDDAKIIKISRRGKPIVVMALNEYNALQETLYLTKSTANKKRLDDAISEMER